MMAKFGKLKRYVYKASLEWWPQLTLKQGSKVKFNTWEKFPEHDFLLVVLTFQISKTTNKGDTSGLLNREYSKKAIAQLHNELQVYNLTV